MWARDGQMPKRRRWFISSPFAGFGCSTGSPSGATHASGHRPKETRPIEAPTHVLQTDPASLGPSTSRIRDIRGRAECCNQLNGARPSRANLRSDIDATNPGSAALNRSPGASLEVVPEFAHSASQRPPSRRRSRRPRRGGLKQQ